jgi:hypothetical protein
MAIKCPRGHWYEPESSGEAGRCPICATQTQSDSSVSDDDVLAIMNMNSPVDSAGGAPGGVSHGDDAAKEIVSNKTITRRRKICPECSQEASYSFEYCPRCGAPLKLVTTELH